MAAGKGDRRLWASALIACLSGGVVAAAQPGAPPWPVPLARLAPVACLQQAAQHFGLAPALLQAIAQVESGGNPAAVNRSNRNGSRDIGLMQINSRWLPTLARWQVFEQDLFDPCVSAHVGAWILADNIARLGPVWRAVGAYNAVTPALQQRYVRRVQAELARQQARAADPGKPATRRPRPP